MSVAKNTTLYLFSIIFNVFSFIMSILQIIYSTIIGFFYGVGPKFIELQIEEKGLKCEIHRSITKDGCIIISQRILPKIENENNKRAVFFQHGFLETGGAYVAYEDSLAIQLANRGYDVWIGHNRGSSYGQDHSASSEAIFWKYNIDDIIKFDLNCQIETMLKISGAEKFAYVGQSQGGAQIVGLLHHYPEYVKKISYLGMIAPALHIKKPDNFYIRLLMSIPPNWFGKKEFLKIIHYAQKSVPAFFVKLMTSNIMNSLGFIKANCHAPGSVFKSVPDGCCSVMHAAHWFQLCHAPGKFSKFDFDAYQNNTYSKEKTTEIYDTEFLHQIPSTYFLGGSDPVIDLEATVNEFKHKHEIHVEPSFGHIDFTWSLDGCRIVHSLFIKNMEKDGIW